MRLKIQTSIGGRSFFELKFEIRREPLLKKGSSLFTAKVW